MHAAKYQVVPKEVGTGESWEEQLIQCNTEGYEGEGWRLVPVDTFVDGKLNNWTEFSLVTKHASHWALNKGHLD